MESWKNNNYVGTRMFQNFNHLFDFVWNSYVWKGAVQMSGQDDPHSITVK